MKSFFLLQVFILCFTISFSQLKPPATDTIQSKVLDSIRVNTFIQVGVAQPLQQVVDNYIFSGKKAVYIQLDPRQINLSGNVARQAFAQVPGLNVWEMDGAGTQINIGSRSTDTHRSIEMNMRQNGYNTNSDIFGYPENHYTAPMQAINEIQYVRGSAALQFGSQFGGMMNYILKKGDSIKAFSLESEQSVGSYNFFNSFNAIGGTVGKLNYYVYYDNRSGDGWRPNANFNYHAYHANFEYRFNNKGSISFQFSRMNYVQKIAGGLTDAQFYQNEKQSFRSRNYFNPEINLPAIVFKYPLSKSTQLELTSHFLFGERNSVQFINTPNVMDTINTTLGTFNPRQVDRDYYSGFTTEARLLHRYRLNKMNNTLVGGIRYFTQTTKRRQKGVGTIGNDFDLTLAKDYGINLHLHTDNYAVFAENIFQFTERFSLTPGMRYEVINTSMNGVIINGTYPVSYSGKRNFPLFGVGTQFQMGKTTQLYGNFTQAYRPYIYANVTPADQIGVIDPNLKDSKGYDIDLGYRGHYRNLVNFDISAFLLFYGDRVGQLTLSQPGNTSTYLYNTNVGNSVAKGLESYIDVSLWKLFRDKHNSFDFRIFNSLAYDHARYTSGQISNAGKNVSLVGNYVEGTPDWIIRTGLKMIYSNLSASLQHSYVSRSFSDANNTAFNVTGATGIVPSYNTWDCSLYYQFLKLYHFNAGINNLTNTTYFTRRINMYPGPGILPADGRTFYFSLGIKI